jgi:N-acetylmuramoyl-L-alanine amidase
MRLKGITVQQIILGLALIAALCWNLAQANEINNLQLTDGATGTRVELHLQGEVAYKTLVLSQPHRFVVDLPGVKPGKTLQLPAPAGLIRGIRTGQPVAGTTRVVFELATPVTVLKPRLEQSADGVRLVLEWPGDGPAVASTAGPSTAGSSTAPPSTTLPSTALPSTAATSPPSALVAAGHAPSSVPQATTPAATTAKPPVQLSSGATAAGSKPPATATAHVTTPNPDAAVAAASQPPLSSAPATNSASTKPATGPATAAVIAPQPTVPQTGPTPMRTQGNRPLVIAIDAGHGGQDPGAIGPSGKREKDVTLAIARELARQINVTPGLRAFLTRDSDMFLSLTRRTQLARQAKADMFISIHADAAENRNARGSSVYVLSLRGASSQRARWLADKENASDLIGGAPPQADNTLTSVLLDLTQSGQLRASEDAAGRVLDGLKKIGNNHKPHLERANFAVLRTSDMPAMLVETAFISNAAEEKRLVDPAFQRSLARAVLDGVDTYFTRQPPPGTLYAARALEQQRLAKQTPASPAKGTPKTAGGSPE